MQLDVPLWFLTCNHHMIQHSIVCDSKCCDNRCSLPIGLIIRVHTIIKCQFHMMLGHVLTESAILKQKLLFINVLRKPAFVSFLIIQTILCGPQPFELVVRYLIITKGPYFPDDMNSSYTLVVVLPLMNK